MNRPRRTSCADTFSIWKKKKTTVMPYSGEHRTVAVVTVQNPYKWVFAGMMNWDFWEMRAFKLLNSAACVLRRTADECCDCDRTLCNQRSECTRPTHCHSFATTMQILYEKSPMQMQSVGRRSMIVRQHAKPNGRKMRKELLRKIYLSSDTSFINKTENEKEMRPMCTMYVRAAAPTVERRAQRMPWMPSWTVWQ